MISLPPENVVKSFDCNQLIHVGKLGIIYSHHIYKENFMKGMKRKLKAIYKTLHAHLRLIFALIYNFYTFSSFLVALLQRCNIFFLSSLLCLLLFLLFWFCGHSKKKLLWWVVYRVLLLVIWEWNFPFWNASSKLENWRNSPAMKLNELCLSNRTLT